MKPSVSILDKSFRYVPSVATSVADTWRRFGWRPATSREREARPRNRIDGEPNCKLAAGADSSYCCEACCFVAWSDGCGVTLEPFKRLSALAGAGPVPAGAGRLPFVVAVRLETFDRVTLASRILSSSCCAEAHSGLAAVESGSEASASGVRSYANAT